MTRRSASRTVGGLVDRAANAPSEVRAAGVAVEVRRSAAARRLSLRVSRLDGRARVTVPVRCDRKTLMSFLAQHEEWLRAAVDRAPSPIDLAAGAATPYRGRLLTIRSAPERRGVRADLVAGVLEIGGASAGVGLRARLWLREQARERLVERVRVHAATLGVAVTSITLRDTRSRWGSCSSSGALAFSWRLILAPDDVLDYVAAHEVAHLVELNHSARFWAVVERLRPDWRRWRRWLRDHGAELHRYRAGETATARAA